MVKILCLQHSTYIKNVIKIFESGALFTELDSIMKQINLGEGMTKERDNTGVTTDNMSLGQYPGVYMSLVTSDQIGKPIHYWSGNVIFVLSASLLNRKDWHFNKHDSEGFINFQNTFYHKAYLEYYLESLTNNDDINDNELVFHHSVPVNFICKIRCKTPVDAKVLLDQAPTGLKKLFKNLIEIVDKYPNKEYNCTGIVRELTPNHCFVFDNNSHYKIKDSKGVPYEGRGFFAHMEYYRWMATKCGLTEEEANEAKTPEELNKKLEPLVRRRFKLVAEGKL